MQRFVPADFEQHYFTLFESEAHHERLKSICAFDVVTNNADRKSGHCLLGEDGTIWGIDNGLCFHEEPKLRTVIWEFEGQPLPEEAVNALTKLTTDFDEVSQQLLPLLDPDAIEAVKRRAERLLASGKLPKSPRGGPHYPWPLV
jgi:uncharacterized repeat protein (TIGR03843 family)